MKSSKNMKSLELEKFGLQELNQHEMQGIDGGQILDRESTACKVGHAIGAVTGQVVGGLIEALKHVF